MTKPIPCPFCGSEPVQYKDWWLCNDLDCPIRHKRFTLKEWNTRAYPRLKKAIEEIEEEQVMGQLFWTYAKTIIEKHIPEIEVETLEDKVTDENRHEEVKDE